jgi:hypothetical protein
MRSAVLLAVLLAGSSLARAQPAPDYAAAKRHYQAAEAASSGGDHATAAREYGIAYDITKDPVLFYKIASAFQRAGDCRSALVYYRRYLAEGKPDDAFAARTKAEIVACEKQAPPAPPAEPPTPRPAEPPAPSDAITVPPEDLAPAAPPPEPRPSLAGSSTTWQQTAAWTSVGVSVALLTTGAVLGLSARSRQEDVENLIDFRDVEGRPAEFDGAARERYEDLLDEGDRLERWSIISLSAAGVAAAAAVVFFVIDDGPAPRAVEVTPAVTPEGAGVSAGWRF